MCGGICEGWGSRCRWRLWSRIFGRGIGGCGRPGADASARGCRRRGRWRCWRWCGCVPFAIFCFFFPFSKRWSGCEPFGLFCIFFRIRMRCWRSGDVSDRDGVLRRERQRDRAGGGVRGLRHGVGVAVVRHREACHRQHAGGHVALRAVGVRRRGGRGAGGGPGVRRDGIGDRQRQDAGVPLGCALRRGSGGLGAGVDPVRAAGLHGVPQGEVGRRRDSGVRPELAHRGAGGGVPRGVADAGRPVRVRDHLLRLRCRGVREDGDGGVGGQQRAHAQHPPPRARAGGRDRRDSARGARRRAEAGGGTARRGRGAR